MSQLTPTNVSVSRDTGVTEGAGVEATSPRSHLAGQQGLPVFWALTKATLLVSGSSRMKPHSLCMGFRVSGWNALNLHGDQGVRAGPR